MKRIFSLLIGLLFIIQLPLKADEGMWLLTMLDKTYDDMKKQGMKLTPEDIYSINNSSIKDAIVIFGGFCTGEIVSDKGLIFTNHHCGYGAIQEHSSVEHDYLKDGFWAMSYEEELHTPGLFASFLVRMEDVSDKVNKELNDDMTEQERDEKIGEISAKIEKEATEGNDYEARVQQFFGGNNFYLMIYETFHDVRFVGAPPSSIGKFGHDTDNWMWPRHTGDFSVFRVYAGPDNKPARYSEDNKPYKPKHHLPISLKGVEEGDFALVLGYPGGTQRYMTSFGVEEQLRIAHPNRIKIRGIKQELMMEDMQANDKVRIQYASKYSRSSNYWKFSIGQSKGIKRLNLVAKKELIEQDFRKWVNKDAKRKEKYGEALDLIKEAYEKRSEYVNARQYIRETCIFGNEIFSAARRAKKLYEMLKDGDDPEKIKELGQKLKITFNEFYKNYNPPTDKKVTKAMMKLLYNDIDKKYHPDIFETIVKQYDKDFDKYVDNLFSTSIFADEKKCMAFLDNPKLETLENDPALKAALSIYEKYYEINGKSEQYDTQLKKGQRLFIAGLKEFNPKKLYYPDANFTMRYTYGTVGDYQPRDAVHYDYYTTMKGIMEKEEPGDYEFHVDPKLKELYEKKDFGPYGQDGRMWVCFTTNNDITGGNSGSPVIDGEGRLIGIAFDGNWEAMSGDIVFEPELQKCINVDIRYVLFVIDKFAGAKNLIEELDIVK